MRGIGGRGAGRCHQDNTARSQLVPSCYRMLSMAEEPVHQAAKNLVAATKALPSERRVHHPIRGQRRPDGPS
jgi:hypothetical protein